MGQLHRSRGVHFQVERGGGSGSGGGCEAEEKDDLVRLPRTKNHSRHTSNRKGIHVRYLLGGEAVVVVVVVALAVVFCFLLRIAIVVRDGGKEL